MPTPANDTWLRTDEPLIWPAGRGREVVRDRRYYFDCTRRPEREHVCLQLALRGRMFVEDHAGRRILTAGHAFFRIIPGPFEYGYPPEDHQPLELVWVSLHGAAAFEWHARITARFGHALALGTQSPSALLLQQIATEPERDRPDRYGTSARFYTLMMRLLSDLSAARVAEVPLVERAHTLIEQHATDPHFTVQTLAMELDISREHLARRFRAAFGTGPHDVLTQHRLRLAARRLRDGEDKLDVIAVASGFAGANYLCRVFRKHVGLTPDAFRKRPWLPMP